MLQLMGLSHFSRQCQWRHIMNFDATILAKFDTYYDVCMP